MVLSDHFLSKFHNNLTNPTTQIPQYVPPIFNLTIRSSALEYCEIVISGAQPARRAVNPHFSPGFVARAAKRKYPLGLLRIG
jgi:hypothetical protein